LIGIWKKVMAKKRARKQKDDNERERFRKEVVQSEKIEPINKESETAAASSNAVREAQSPVSEDSRRKAIAGIEGVNPTEAEEDSEAGTVKQITVGEGKMADTTREMSQGFSETMDRAESAGRRLTETAKSAFENASKAYGAFFSIDGARKIAEVYIETNEKLAKEALEFSRKFVELSAGGARRFWQVAEEHGREARSNV